VLSKEHLDTFAGMHNLATVLMDQGEYGEAEQIYREVIGVMERVQGKEHRDALGSMNDLSVVLTDQCQYEEAMKIQEVVVEGMVSGR
jgi:hypothetical protein